MFFYAKCILKSFNSHISVVVCSFFEFGTVSKWCISEWVNPAVMTIIINPWNKIGQAGYQTSNPLSPVQYATSTELSGFPVIFTINLHDLISFITEIQSVFTEMKSYQ